MTIDPFDMLEDQLREHVAKRRTPKRSWWRTHRLAAVVAVVGLGATGGAFAAGALRGPGDEQRGRSIAYSVINSTRHEPACTMPKVGHDGPITVVDAATPPALLAAFPWMGSPARRGELRRGVRLINKTRPLAGTQVVRSTIRVVRLDARWEMLTRLEYGNGMFGVRDPAACQALRARVLAIRLAGEGPGVRSSAKRRLAIDTSANPGATTLWLTLVANGQPSSGSGITLLPGPGTGLRHEVPHGLLSSTIPAPHSSRPSRYDGLADPSTVSLRVWSKRASVRRLLPRTVSVHRGFWRLELPPRTGPVRLTEFDSRGRAGRVVRVRGK